MKAISLNQMCRDIGWDPKAKYVKNGPRRIEDEWWAQLKFQVRAQRTVTPYEIGQMELQLPGGAMREGWKT